MRLEEIEIPESEDLEWQQKMLRKLAGLLDVVYSESAEEGNCCALEESQAIVEALREYSGY